MLDEAVEVLLLAGVLLAEDDESEVDAAGLLVPESDLLSEAVAEISDFPSDLLEESLAGAVLLPDFA